MQFVGCKFLHQLLENYNRVNGGVMRKIKYLAILLLVLGFVLLTANCTYADKIINTNSKKLELPSKIHKNGEGFYEIGRMLIPRYRHSSILLADGKVFIVGGNDKNGHMLNSTEIFDPKTGKSLKGPDMPYAVFKCTLKLLSNSNVLIVGGQDNNQYKVSVYIPKENKIIEVEDRLQTKIIRDAAIAEISNEDVFINDSYYISKKFGFGIYNKQMNKLSIKHSETTPASSVRFIRTKLILKLIVTFS